MAGDPPFSFPYPPTFLRACTRTPAVPSLLPLGIALLLSACSPVTAALGINCRGHVPFCNPAYAGLPVSVDLISSFWDALSVGNSTVVPGGPIADTSVYHGPYADPRQIACRALDGGTGICLFLQGNVPAAGVDGSVVKARVADLNNHGCWYCGSVPLSGNNHPEEMGILTSNYVRNALCNGVC
ncbi:MAG: hypothetical protein FRX48_00216 [Lasallia pustulata]|uniref:Killer toxin Kp4 domain-containing protein n=1 Tax=Lasallia pustulata TaxID=136370 RepID=A0A5M8Q3B7_9LECA|nr:MAG: hypothetical protein FRX48_00216 [Lasallia pustulata]